MTVHVGNFSTDLFTYLLTPWCRVLPEQLTALQLVKKFPAFHGTGRFITALTSVRHLSLSADCCWEILYVSVRFLASTLLTVATPVLLSQIKHQLDAILCRFYFCRVTLHVSGVKRPSSGVLKNWHGVPWYRCYSCR